MKIIDLFAPAGMRSAWVMEFEGEGLFIVPTMITSAEQCLANRRPFRGFRKALGPSLKGTPTAWFTLKMCGYPIDPDVEIKWYRSPQETGGEGGSSRSEAKAKSSAANGSAPPRPGSKPRGRPAKPKGE